MSSPLTSLASLGDINEGVMAVAKPSAPDPEIVAVAEVRYHKFSLFCSFVECLDWYTGTF